MIAAFRFLLMKSLVAPFLLAASLSFQPDLVFPWALAWSIYFLLTKPKLGCFLKNLSVGVIGLLPFLIQQIYLNYDSKLSATKFVSQSYQVLVAPDQFLGQFGWLLGMYSLGFVSLFSRSKEIRRLSFVILAVTVFYAFYPLVLHYLFPHNSTLRASRIIPFNTFGLFKDIIFPFTGKYYFYRQGISLGLILFGCLGMISLVERFKFKVLPLVLCILLMILTMKNHSLLLNLGPMTPKEGVEQFLTLVKGVEIKSLITPSASSSRHPFWIYESQWYPSMINVLGSGDRTFSSGSDIFVNYSYSNDVKRLENEFWVNFNSNDSDVKRTSLYLKNLKPYYSHLLSYSGPPCRAFKNISELHLTRENELFCLFKFN